MTTLPPLATVADLAELLLRPISDDDSERAEAVLDDASTLIRAEAGDTTWVDDDGETITAPPVVVMVTKAVAKRAFLNPAGYSSETLGDWTGRRTDGESVSSGVYLTKNEKRLVRRAAQISSMGAVQLASPFSGAVTEWIDVEPAPADPIPWYSDL